MISSARQSMLIRRFLCIFLLLSLVASINLVPSVRAADNSQTGTDLQLAQQMLEKMTPEEKVGQLFLVTFNGSTVNDKSQIYDLITRYHIGGVVLRAENDNFVAAPDTVTAAYQLIAQLQDIERQASLPQPTPTSTPPGTPASTLSSTPTFLPPATPVPVDYIPLFAGISQEGDGYPNDQILSGLTPLPDLMALGAAWDPSLAQQVGSVAGQELSSMGFNLFLGPSLDVLDSPEAALANGLNADVFGGDPYWVGAMGSAYINGLHTGSNERMLVIADHFPGSGSADRPAGEEPATVVKSLDQLKQTELAPFFAVTGNALTPQSTVDGLLVSHIRYQGFQGSIHSTTRPVSLDPQALGQILTLPAFSTWRSAGGLLVSDDLGSQTVRLFYDPTGQSFEAHLAARDALLAGNDLLYMGNIVSSDEKDTYSSVIETMNFFTQKYLADAAFAKRVDDAVSHILTLKYRLYGDFGLGTITPPETGLAQVDQSETVTFDVAKQSVTLISPDKTDLETVLPSPPVVGDHIVFLTDARTERQCSTCTETPMLDPDALQNAILRLYGSQAGGQVIAGRLVSYSLDAVTGILQGGTGNQDLENALNQANWVVINILDAGPGQPQTTLLHRFLSERQDLLHNKNVVVFAFNAPYFLDATDISKITAYYCLYSKSAPFVEVAARLLFRELSPIGTSPVSVEGIGYDLASATAPDPTQVINLSLDIPSPSVSTPAAGTQTPAVTPAATPTPFFRVGDTVSARTGIIFDHNGHPVPDGTGVQFQIAMNGAGGYVQQFNSVTFQGVARATFNIDRAGLLEITASSAPAISSVVLQLDVTSQGSSVTIVTPTPIPEFTPTPTVFVPTPTQVVVVPLAQGFPGFGGWLVVVLFLCGFGLLAFWLGDRFATLRWGVRWATCVFLGGILAYTYLAVRLPGAAEYLQKGRWSGMLGVVLFGAAIGWGGAYAWYRILNGARKRPG
ncbi:MAG: glycoside hydrolase family 3 N-terminal domain-containing protein [Anaerolineales bacterium]